MATKFAQFCVTVLLGLTLTACFHIQLNGSVGGGTLTVAPLRNPGNVLDSAVSWAPSDLLALWGQEKWDSHTPFVNLVFVGITPFEPEGLNPEALYVLTASGGQDFDPDAQLELSDNPKVVQGSWHMIASGKRISEGNLKVSALTEALYQQLAARLGEWSDDEVLARLNASAQLLVGDVDESGSVDYDDVLRWNRTLDGPFYRGDLAAVDALSDAITAGQPASSVINKAKDVLGKHTVLLQFDVGTVEVETLNWESPITVANFLGYVRSGYYDSMLVHRSIDGFMIQLGLVEVLGTDEEGQIQWELKTAGASIVNESSNGVSNTRGALSMARTNNPDSASSQFFVNQASNTFLDYGSGGNPDGYAVFARVISGMAVVDDIAGEPTVTVTRIGSDVTARGVILESAQWVE